MMFRRRIVNWQRATPLARSCSCPDSHSHSYSERDEK
jgi:hypothetical protein